MPRIPTRISPTSSFLLLLVVVPDHLTLEHSDLFRTSTSPGTTSSMISDAYASVPYVAERWLSLGVVTLSASGEGPVKPPRHLPVVRDSSGCLVDTVHGGSMNNGNALSSERVASWFFRLNGCLTIDNFILHPDFINPSGRQRTDADVLGVRFPNPGLLA
jgi:hypothetical protein